MEVRKKGVGLKAEIVCIKAIKLLYSMANNGEANRADF